MLASGIIPWIGNDSGTIYTSSPAGIVPYTGPAPAQIEGASATDNVRTTNTVDPLTANRSINSLRVSGNVDTGGNVLNIGTATINGVASGAVYLVGVKTIGSGNSPGYLTAGQSIFAPNSATRGELVVHAVANSATIAAGIVDNAGADGVFGNGDDLPVSLTVTSGGTLNLTGNNTYTGGTFINEGTVEVTSPLPGNVRLNVGELHLSSANPDAFLVGGDITVSNSANATSTRAIIQTPTYTRPFTGRDRTASLLHGLTVTPGSVASVRGDIALMGTADFRGAQVYVNTNSSLIGNSSLHIRGSYMDDAETLIRSRISSGVPLLYTDGVRFQTGSTVDVHATIADVPRFSAELNTTVNFYGTLAKSDSMSFVSERIIAAATGGTARLMPGATIDAAKGGSGHSYGSDALRLDGDSSGTIEFVQGFKLMQISGSNHEADLGANNLMFQAPVTLITNDSDNLPNFAPSVMNDLPPNIYPGEINMRADGARWIVQSNPQTYNQKIDFAADTRIVTNSPLTFTAESAVGMGDKDNILLSPSELGLRGGTQSGSLEKLGHADLSILGRLYVANYTRMIVSEGRLLLSNKSYEGYGRMDMEVRNGATLGGGSIDGTAGLLPGLLKVKPGGTVDPGNSAYGILSVIGDRPDIELEADSIFSPDIGGVVSGQSYDQLKLVGNLVLGENSDYPILAPKLNYSPMPDDLIFIVRNDGTTAVTGLFKSSTGATLSQGTILPVSSSVDGQKHYFEISYSGDAISGEFQSQYGNDISLRIVVIPEPASLTLVLLGIVAFWCGNRRGQCKTAN